MKPSKRSWNLHACNDARTCCLRWQPGNGDRPKSMRKCWPPCGADRNKRRGGFVSDETCRRFLRPITFSAQLQNVDVVDLDFHRPAIDLDHRSSDRSDFPSSLVKRSKRTDQVDGPAPRTGIASTSENAESGGVIKVFP